MELNQPENGDLEYLKARSYYNLDVLREIVNKYLSNLELDPFFNAEFEGAPLSKYAEVLDKLAGDIVESDKEFAENIFRQKNHYMFLIECLYRFNDLLVELSGRIDEKRSISRKVESIYSLIRKIYRSGYVEYVQLIIEKFNTLISKYNKYRYQYFIPEHLDDWEIFLFRHDLLYLMNSGYETTKSITLDEIIDILNYIYNLQEVLSPMQLYHLEWLTRVIVRRRLDYLQEIIEGKRSSVSNSDTVNELEYIRKIYLNLVRYMQYDELEYNINLTHINLDELLNFIKNKIFGNEIPTIKLKNLNELYSLLQDLLDFGDTEWIVEFKEDIEVSLNDLVKFYSTKSDQTVKIRNKLKTISKTYKLLNSL